MSDRALSNAYLRLRALIPGAYDTPHAPTPEQVWATTEAALRRLLERDATEEEWRSRLASQCGQTLAARRQREDVERARAVARKWAQANLSPTADAPLRMSEMIAVALTAVRRKEREACARHIEAIARQLRDNGPTTPEGLLTALAGAQVGALLDAAASLRAGDAP